MENRKKIDLAIFLDGYNERCGSYEYAKHLNNSFSILTEKPYLMWKKTSRNFLHTLPIAQFANLLFGSGRWINDGNNNILKIDSCDEKVGLDDLFESRLSLRNSFCEINGIICHSFLQPMAGAVLYLVYWRTQHLTTTLLALWDQVPKESLPQLEVQL